MAWVLACRSVARVVRVLERWCEAEVREAVKAARASGVWGEGAVVVVVGWVGIVCWWGGGGGC